MGLGYWVASHPLFDPVLVTLRRLTSLGCSEIVPHMGKHIVLWYAFAHAVHIPEGALGKRIPLLRARTQGRSFIRILHLKAKHSGIRSSPLRQQGRHPSEPKQPIDLHDQPPVAKRRETVGDQRIGIAVL